MGMELEHAMLGNRLAYCRIAREQSITQFGDLIACGIAREHFRKHLTRRSTHQGAPALKSRAR